MQLYKASEIVERAFDLANMQNTKFVSYREKLQYLNDSWREFYQYIINKGDLQFVVQVRLNQGSFTLPKNLYSIASIKDEENGQLYTRLAQTEAKNTPLRYEIINDVLTVTGGSNNPVLTYYTVPVYLTFPAEPVALDYSVVASSNTRLLTSDGNVRNAETGDIDESWMQLDDLSNIYALAGSYVWMFQYVEGVTYTAAINGKDGSVLTLLEGEPEFTYRDYNDNVYVSINGVTYKPNGVATTAITANTLLLEDGTTLTYTSTDIDGLEFDVSTDQALTAPKINGRKVYFLAGGDQLKVYDTYNESIYDGNNNSYSVEALSALSLVTPENNLLSVEGDTLLNFPNELYFSALAANIAMRLKMKSGEDYSSLSVLYENMLKTYFDTLSQDSGYTRINNVYD